jgi:hypothetical protein
MPAISYTTPSGGVTSNYKSSAYYLNRMKPQREAQAQQRRLSDYYSQLEAGARTENLAAEKEVRGILGNQISRVSKDSPFYKAGVADIENQASSLVSGETQNLISSGLYGTTTASSIPTRVANEFTRPARLKLEDLLLEKKSAAELNLAQFIERIERPYPDLSPLFQASQAAGTR